MEDRGVQVHTIMREGAIKSKGIVILQGGEVAVFNLIRRGKRGRWKDSWHYKLGILQDQKEKKGRNGEIKDIFKF